jgi:DNA-directed RNA polymerase beta subunit
MTTIRQLIQTSPAKANELFAKLTETSGNAVKTREKLFADLKAELELQIKLEEQHLFPVLKKRKETKDLVSGALNDNKQTRKLLTELERTPKESEEFASKVAELRKAFQQHVRDERKELLPAVLKALDDEEAEAIVEKIEGAKAEAEAAKRAEAEAAKRAEAEAAKRAEAEAAKRAEAEAAKRAEAEAARAAREEREKAEAVARQAREQVETVRQAAESVGNVVRVSAQAPRRVAETAREAVQGGVGVAAQMAQRAADFGASSFSDVTRRWQNAAASMTAVSQANSGLVMRYQAIWREVFQLAHQATQERTESLTRFMSVRSPQQLLDANVDLIQREAQRFFDGQARVSQLLADAARDAQQRIEEASSVVKESEAAQDKGRQTGDALPDRPGRRP